MKIILSVGMLFLMCSCATKMSDVRSDESPTMKEIQDGVFNEITVKQNEDNSKVNVTPLKRKVGSSVDYSGYTRTAKNEHKVLFERLENPIMIGYVYAHLTRDGTPIPAYSIPFRMSPRDYYAMPGEKRKLN